MEASEILKVYIDEVSRSQTSLHEDFRQLHEDVRQIEQRMDARVNNIESTIQAQSQNFDIRVHELGERIRGLKSFIVTTILGAFAALAGVLALLR